jgi:hypothetical protein
MSVYPLIRILGVKMAAIERNRPYRVRNRIFSLPPLSSSPGRRKLAVLCEPRTFSDACWSAWSWLRFIGQELSLHIFVDGLISREQQNQFKRQFPGAALSSLPEFLENNFNPSPVFARFSDHHVLARKLALLIALQRDADFLYSDCDVVVFRRPDMILEAIRGSIRTGLYMMELGSDYFVDPWIAETAAKIQLAHHRHLNSGLLWILQDSLRVDVIERLLSDWHPKFSHRSAEQSILGVLMALNNARPLPPDDYVVSNDGMFFWQRDRVDYTRITARHYVGNVRHLLYRKALPRLLEMEDGSAWRSVAYGAQRVS